MNKKKINRYIIILVFILLLTIIYVQFFSKVEEKEEKIESVEIDYSSSGIDPNKYEKIEDFLEDFNTFSGAQIDISKDNFVICKKDSKGNISYTPFYQSYIKKGMFDIKNEKNEAIVDIYKSYKEDCIHGGYGSDSGSKIIFEEDIGHDDTYIINNIFTRKSNFNDIINELENIPNKSIEKKELVSYLYDLKGNYKDARKNRFKTCIENKVTCNKSNDVKLYGKILDENNKPLSGVKITLLNNDKKSVVSNEEGEYIFEFKYYPFAHLRFKATIDGYSDAFKSISLNTINDLGWNKVEKIDFHLTKAHKSYSVENENRDNIVILNNKKYFEFKSKQSKYLVPVDGFVFKDLKKWDGNNFNVYLYEFTKWDNTSDLVQVDTFNEVSGYVGNLMKTFGMPYIQFIDSETGKELFIKKSNPIILQNNIYHMQELYDNYDGVYDAITKEDMEFLVKYSIEKGGYPIDFQFLTENNFLRWPAWWALDRLKGTWESIPAKVLTVDGLIETEFYSLNDL